MTTPSRRSTRAWLITIFVLFTLSGIGIATWLGRVPSVRDSLHASTFEMGLLVIGMSAGSIVGITVAGHVVGRLGARTGARIAAGCLTLGMVTASAAVTFHGGFWAIWICLIAFGFGNGLLDVSMNVSGATVERATGRTVMPLFHAAFSLGTLAGAGLGSVAEILDVPVFLHIGGTGVVLGIAILVASSFLGEERFIEPIGTDATPVPVTQPVSRWAVWAMPSTILIGLIALGMALAEGSANDWLALAMVDGHGLDNAAGTAVLSVFVASMTVGRVFGVLVIDRLGRVPVLRGSAALAVIGMAMLIFVPNVPIAIAGVVLWGLGAALGFPVGMSAAADDPRTAAARVSAVATLGYLAFLVGPPIIGLVGEYVGLLHALLIVFVFIVVAGIVSGAAREKPAPADGAPAQRADGTDDAPARPAAGGEAPAGPAPGLQTDTGADPATALPAWTTDGDARR